MIDARTMARTLAIARGAATARPDALHPCPRCYSPIRGRNLATHLDTVHAERAAPSDEPAATVRVRGSARYLRIPLAIAFVATMLAFVPLAVVHPHPTDAEVLVIGVVFLATFGPLLMVLLGRMPAFLELDASRIRLLGPFGREVRSIAWPCSIASGRMSERRPNPGSTADHDAGSHEVDAGTYLRLASGSSQLTIGGRGAPRLDRRWSTSGVAKGSKLTRWDITVDAASLVAIEYHLATRGLLEPKAE